MEPAVAVGGLDALSERPAALLRQNPGSVQFGTLSNTHRRGAPRHTAAVLGQVLAAGGACADRGSPPRNSRRRGARPYPALRLPATTLLSRTRRERALRHLDGERARRRLVSTTLHRLDWI